MYFIANLQPRLPESFEDKYGFLTHNEKKIIIDKFSKNKLKGITLDICEDHAGGKNPGFTIDQDKKIGKINDMIINNNGDLMIIGELFGNHPQTKSIIKEMSQTDSKDYGVSLWLDLLKDDNSSFKNKNLNHVALTTSPGLGKYGSYIFEWSWKKEKIDNIFRDSYYDYKNNSENGIRYASKDLLNIWNQGKFFFKFLIIIYI
jgi:hypothetical protein